MKKTILITCMSYLFTLNAFALIVGNTDAPIVELATESPLLVTTTSLPTLLIADTAAFDDEILAMVVIGDEEVTEEVASQLDVSQDDLINAVEVMVESDIELSFENLEQILN